jgi:hypothetical protein
MQGDEPRRHLDASELAFEAGRQTQAVALVMRKHEIVPAHQLCVCGRLAARILPLFGLRCEIACRQWDLAYALNSRLMPYTAEESPANQDGRVVGRVAAVHIEGRRT